MKKYIFLLAVLFGVANAQRIAVDSSYATNDTTAWYSQYGGNAILLFQADDSINVKLEIDYAESKNSTAPFGTYVAADSTNSVVGAGMLKGYVLRYNSTNNIPGAGAIRLRVTRLTGSGKNGTTTPTYNAWIRPY